MVLEISDGVAVIGLPQQYNLQNLVEFSDASKKAFETKCASIAVDFGVTTIIDSSAIGSLVTLLKESRKNGITLTLRNLNDKIRQLFEDTELDRIFNIETARGMTPASAGLFEQGAAIKLEIRHEDRGNVHLLHLSGIMNHPVGSRHFKQEFLLALTAGKKILLNLEQLTFFDSLSVGDILTMNRLLKETGGSLRICAANYIVSDLFATLNIDRIVPIYPTIEDAMTDWKTA